MAAVLVTNISVYIGTAAERAALSTTGMKAGSIFEETDTGLKYKWSGAAWFVTSDENVALGAGTALIGKVGIDQATANANEVVVKSITAGANVIGQVSINQTTDGTTNKVRTIPKQSAAAPAASPVTVETTAGGTVLVASNASRISVTLQNVGTEPCIVRLGGDPSTAAYNLVLAEDSAARAGDGGSVTITDYTGAIKGITEANTTVIAVTEVA